MKVLEQQTVVSRGATTVFVVDDDEASRRALLVMLRGEGYRLLEFARGDAAIEHALGDPPDLALVDVRMPGADGFEVARALKAQAAAAYLPVILVTGAADQDARLASLDTLADDLLSKPVEQRELLARVRNLLLLRAHHLSLLKKNVELAELHRFKDEMSSLVVHDLKNPMASIISNLRFVLGDAGALDADQLDALGDALGASQRALRLIENLLDVTRIEAGRLQPRLTRTRLDTLVAGALRHRERTAASRQVTLESTLPPTLEVEVDEDLLARVIENVLDNGMRYTPTGGRLRVDGAASDGQVELRIANTGPAIPAAVRRVVFEKFGQATQATGRMNLGLGLYFCRLAMEAHGGRIWVDEAPQFPTVFHLAFPVAPPQR